MEQLRIGIVGCGVMGASHARVVASVPSIQLSALYDPDHRRAETISTSFGGAVLPSLGQMLENPELDAVIVASPSDDHLRATLLVAQAGKHVLLEKPAALTLSDLDQIQAACDSANVVLMVGQTLRFDGVVEAAREACLAGEIGHPVYVNWVSNTSRKWPGGWRGWQTNRTRSGGMALHMAIHSIDLALWILDGVPSEVYAHGCNVAASGLDVDDFVQISIRCQNGSHALLESHSSLPGVDNSYTSLRVIGTAGQVQWSSRDDGAYVGASGSRVLSIGPDDRLRRELTHFADCCMNKASPIVLPNEVWNAHAAAIAANQSLSESKVVSVREARTAEVW